MNKELLRKYAQTIIRIGVNLQIGERIVINSDVCMQELAEIIAEESYKSGASKVYVYWRSQHLTRLDYSFGDEKALLDPPQWLSEQRNYIADNKLCYIALISDDPELLSDLDLNLVSKVDRLNRERASRFFVGSSKNDFKWCIAAAPSIEWAKRVFPELNETIAYERLWDLVFQACRIDCNDPVASWREHIECLEKRCKVLNEAGIKELVYKNSIGTNIRVGLPEEYRFLGGAELSSCGESFSANIPTEEVFTAPHRDRVDGKIVSSIPLFHNGQRIEGMWLVLEKGVIVDYGASTGYDVLKKIIDTDDGSKRLGEVALISYDSPINQTNTLYLNTLFDENASCHFAIGFAYASSINEGTSLTKEELLEKGLNSSLTHVDFMVGTRDLSIIGILESGEELQIFKDGNFAF